MNSRVFTALALGAAIAFSTGPVLAQSAQDQAACRGDAMKHCSSSIGKPDEMKQCLVKNKDKLSADCKKVVESRGG
jgi:hypothetical protein